MICSASRPHYLWTGRWVCSLSYTHSPTNTHNTHTQPPRPPPLPEAAAGSAAETAQGSTHRNSSFCSQRFLSFTIPSHNFSCENKFFLLLRDAVPSFHNSLCFVYNRIYLLPTEHSAMYNSSSFTTTFVTYKKKIHFSQFLLSYTVPSSHNSCPLSTAAILQNTVTYLYVVPILHNSFCFKTFHQCLTLTALCIL